MEKMQQETVGAGLGDSTRRNFLKGVAAVGASALLPSSPLSAEPAQAPAGKARVIDCHHHFGSPGYAKALAPLAGHRMAGYSTPGVDVVKRWQDYSPAKAVEYLDKNDVATAMLSCTTPGLWFGNPEQTRFMARDMNDFAAKMISDYKGRFGLFGLLPLPDIDGSLKEIEHALDTLHADGVCVFSSYGERHWLGDSIFHPVFDELNRRKAVVFVHPMNAFQDSNHVGITEFLQDTMRAIGNLLLTDSATRYGDIKFIFSHAGGTMPSLIERFGICEPGAYPEVLAAAAEPNSRLYHLRRFYYDAANSCNPVQLQALKMVLNGDTSHIVFGSDWPMIPTNDKATIGIRQVQGLAKCGFSAKELAGIHRGNAAEKLIPRLMKA
jgi:predicted TIM-barrel fold metal-dependent hydrolase